jgi:excisionase family DNA binding protein
LDDDELLIPNKGYANLASIRRAIRAARSAGIIVTSLEIRPDGTIRVSNDPSLTEPERVPDWRPTARLYREAEKDKQEAEAARRAYSPKDLADRWTCSAELVRSMIRRGELKAFRYGKMLRITREEVERIESVRRGVE